MSFSNTDYLLEHLPGRFVANDTDGLLRRFLSVFGDRFDEYDEIFDTFSAKIAAGTAPVEWVEAWIYILFGWSWFPWWFTLSDKRRVYGNFATHLARRGTRVGIEKWLRDFGIVARVYTRSQPWGEFVWGEGGFQITQPLRTIVEIVGIPSVERDIATWGEGVWGEFYYARPRRMFTDREIADLVHYMRPNAQEITVLWRLRQAVEFVPELDGVYWGQVSW